MNTMTPLNVLPGLNNASGAAGSLFGAGVGAAGEGAGLLGGLFSQLFGAAGDGLSSDLTALGGGDRLSGDVLASLKDLLGQEFGGAAAETPLGSGFGAAFVAGEAASFQVAVVEIKIVVTKLQTAGFNMDDMLGMVDLAAAFETLGMEAAEALLQAERVEQMLAFVRSRLGLEGGENDFGAGLLQVAEAAPMLEQVAMQVQVQVMQVTTQVLAFDKVAAQAPITDVAALVYKDKPLVQASGEPLVARKQDVQQFTAQMADLLPAVANPASKVAAAVSAAEVAVDAVAEQPVAAAVKPAAPVVSEAAAVVNQAAARAADVKDNRKIDVIEAGKELKAPTGVEVYKWQVTKTGLDVVQQVGNAEALALALDEGADEALVQLKTDAAGGKVSDAALSDNRIPFAERLLMAAKAQVTQQVGAQIQTTAQQGGGTVRIQLNPEELGRVDIELQVRDGKVHGVIAAERPEVLEQMARELQILKQSLASAGFDLGDAGMSLMLKQNESDSNDAQYASNGNEQSTGENLSATDGTRHAPQRWVAPNRLLDLNV